jgi:hypothetical protein
VQSDIFIFTCQVKGLGQATMIIVLINVSTCLIVFDFVSVFYLLCAALEKQSLLCTAFNDRL